MSHEHTGYHAPINVGNEFDEDGELTRPIWPVVAFFAFFAFIFLVALVCWLVRFFLQR